MEFLELVKKRYSVRAYKPDPVEDDKLEQVLQAARLAPTAANQQPFQIVVLHTEGRQSELSSMYGGSWLVQAPLILCACALPDQGWKHANGKNYTDVDVAIAIDHLTLAAASLGLGTCWIAAFDPEAVRKILDLPKNVDPLILIPLGYPADQPKPKRRKSLSELVRYEHW